MNDMDADSYFDLIVDNSLVAQYQQSDSDSLAIPLNTKISLLRMNASSFQMNLLGRYPYAAFPSLFTLDSKIHAHSGIDRVQQNPNLSLYGQGVLIGVIDTGIDYTHPAFRYPDGTSRIVALWDQTLPPIHPHTPPKQFPYGSEYAQSALNEALKSTSPLEQIPSVDENGHGTMIAGLIAGNTTAEFSGVVPLSELLIVKVREACRWNKEIFCIPKDCLCYEESDVIAALSYIYAYAKALNRPLAICIAMGTSQGGHNGKGATSSYLDFITHTPHCDTAIAGGNEGNRKRHYHGYISETFYSDFELHVSNRDSSFAMEIWVTSPYRISLDITTPNGETIQNIYPRLNECRDIHFVLNSTLLWINNIVSESDTGDQVILIRFQNVLEGLWRFRTHSIDREKTTFHVWLPANDLISSDTYFLESDPDYTLTSPANSAAPLCVCGYNDQTGTILADSGRGYTRYESIKPDIAAPAFSLLSTFPKNSYQSVTGTGAASAIATGIEAMVLEWAVLKGQYTAITGSDINRLLIRGAYRQKQLEYPNRQWGYGAIDIYGLFEKLT